MGTTGESLRLKVFGIMRVSATKALRELRVEELTAAGADRLLDDVLAIEKAMAGLKVLLADRASEGQGARYAADRLARRSGTSQRQAAELLAAAKKVADQPKVEAALRDGALSEEQATLIVDAAAANPAATDALLETAKSEPLHGLKDRCGRAKAAADADEDATNARIHAARCLRTGRDPEGAFTASMRGTAADGARFLAFLQPFREAIFEANRQAGRRDTSEAMDFDALMAMAGGAQDRTGSPAQPPAQVNVVVDFDALIGRHRPGTDRAYIAGLGPVPVSAVREILDDAFLVAAVMHGTEVAKIKRLGRHVPLELRDALRIRDRYHCTTVGCTNWARLEMDHTIPYARGGETSYQNLDHLCDTCHKHKTRRDRLFDDTG
jgi:uncharacterized protein DUF222/HNH endonuclease